MKVYSAESIRNVCLLAHGGVGKTSLAEAALFTAKTTTRMGSVDAGSSIFDSRADEKERKMTVSMAVGYCEWNDCKINFLDVPGFLDFLCEAKAALRIAETALLLVDGTDGVQVGTEIAYRYVEESGVARMFFVNSMDKENADFEQTLASLKDAFGTSVAPLVIPIGSGSAFKGVVDLVTKEAYEYEKNSNGAAKKCEIPSAMLDTVEVLRGGLIESVAETDEALMNAFFENGELSDDELRTGIAKGVLEGVLFPVLSGSATGNMGVDQVLTKIVNLCPSAATRSEVEVVENGEKKMVPCGASQPASAFVFKVVSEEHLGEIALARVFSGSFSSGQDAINVNKGSSERLGTLYAVKGNERVEVSKAGAGDIVVMLKLKETHSGNTLAAKGVKYEFPRIAFPEPLVSIAIAAVKKGDEEKVGVGLHKLHEEDPTFVYRYHPDLRQSILSAMGDIHIEVILQGLKNRFKVEVERTAPKISYRETITKTVKYIDYTHKKQTGGAGQYAKVFVDVEPNERGGGYEFVDKIVGGVIDQSLRPSVNKGITAKLNSGIIAGYPIVDVKVSLVDGKMHPVDSKDVAFQIAGREVFKKAFHLCSPILLEPIADIKVTMPNEYTGDVMGDLSSRRGRVGGMDPEGKYTVINAKVPEAEVQTYSQTLRSISQGRGFYTKTFSHYEPVPPDVQKKIVASSKVEEDAD